MNHPQNHEKKKTARLTMSRRSFIVTTATVTGGLIVGLQFPACDQTPAKSVSKVEGEVFNWVVIAPDNTVTIRIAQMELGQGTMTAMAQLLAEELEVDCSKVKVEFIDMATHLNRNKIYGRTSTGLSAGVYLSENLLRTAGAQIRTMFIKAAANRLGVSASELTAEKSMVIHTVTGRKLTYGELAVDAAKIEVPDPESVTIKNPKDWKSIGRSIKRLDIPSMVDGTTVFGMDVNVPGMKFAAIAMCPVFKGRLKSYDRDVALSCKGVLKVVELDDALAVVANDWWQAKSILDKIPKEWDYDSPASVDSIKMLDNYKTGLQCPPDQIFRDDGNTDAAMKDSTRILESDYFVPYLAHAPMEPINCTALVTDDGFEVWTGTQSPEDAFETAAMVLEQKKNIISRAASKVGGLVKKVFDMPTTGSNLLNVLQMGGSFGSRHKTNHVAQAVQIAHSMKGTPVKLIWSREDTIRHLYFRPAIFSKLRAALDQSGNITAWSQRMVAQSNCKNLYKLGSDSLLYAIPNMRVDFVGRGPRLPIGPLRGVGFNAHCFFTQSFVDELAVLAGKDTYQFQKELLAPEKVSLNAPLPQPDSRKNQPRVRAARLRAVLDKAALMADWNSPLGKNRGRGIAVHEQARSFFAYVVEVTLDNKGWFSIDRVVVAVDPGYLVNPLNAEAQIEGCVVFALTCGLYGEITLKNGGVVESNYHDYPILLMNEMPKVEVHWVLSAKEWGGLGDAAGSSVIPALTNAIYNAGGPRIRSLPIKNHKIVKRGQEG
jgi:Aerobic-type carbon monoxide dehydrogenase, large subunit CoxL/CutL homologs